MGFRWAAAGPECLSVLQAVESIQAEDESAKLCKRRIEHLKEHSSDQPAAASVWKRKRMDRMMVEHLLRCGYYNTAVKLARQSGIEVGRDGPRCVLSQAVPPSRDGSEEQGCGRGCPAPAASCVCASLWARVCFPSVRLWWPQGAGVEALNAPGWVQW